jgi:class 3 adenylate cyclase/tetratricopeptide (TPR) repeat protein
VSLEPIPEHHAESQPRERGLAGERRHLTVLFCDLVGSTEIAAQLDPEEWREVVASYHRAAAEAITRFGGYVAQYLGDGVMAYFGWPEAHENNAERAVRAGLAMLETIAKLNERPSHPKLSTRVGIDSGTVVVGAGAGKDVDVFGDVPNIAARVQSAAEPDTVLITAAAQRLISGLFVVDDRGKQALKGIEQPLQLYRVIRPSDVKGRLQAAATARALTPFIGRDDELRLLMTRWERALQGEGQMVLISGEGGIGKSRLVQRFHQQIGGRPHNWFEAPAAPFFQYTPLYPIGEMLRELQAQRSNALGLESDTALVQPSRRGIGLSNGGGSNGHSANRDLFAKEAQPGDLASLVQLDIKPQLAIAQIALNLTTPVEHPASVQAHRCLLSTLAMWVLDAAHVLPVVMVIEDLHWADASTLELVQLLVEQAATAPLLVLCTARPEFRANWPLRSHVTQITLGTLSVYHTRTMVEEVVAQKTLSEETVATIVERAGGVPLFVEELTRAVLESGSAKLAGREIPVTLHDSLMARLDRLGPAKEVIQIGAVIGGEFSYELLHAVHPVGAEELQSALRSATDAELIYVRGIAPEATYQFKHALIRDAAYEALLKSRRKELHGQVACTISDKFPVLKEAHPEVLAHHWAEAGETAQAIAEWTRAGKAAESHHAFKEAQQSYEQALALLSLLPDSAERDLHELDLRQSIVQMLIAISGFSSPENVEARARAIALAKKTGNLSQLVSLMHDTGYAAWYAGDYETAATLADQVLELAVNEGNPTNLGLAYGLQIVVRHFRGDLAGAEEHFARGLKFFEAATIWSLPFARLTPFGIASWNAWMLGRADLARERLARLMAETNQNNPAEVAWSGWLASLTYLFLREYERAEMLAARALELLEKHQMLQVAEYARCYLGLARARLGRQSEGVAMIHQGIAGLAAIGMQNDIFILFLAESQALSGAIGDALATVEKLLQPNRPDAAKILQPEAFRLRGELQTKQGQLEPAEADFRTALTLARSMGAKAWELRAATSLAHLLRDTGRGDEARTTLAEIYNRFTEGFDTADLKEAKVLLDELSA